MKRRILLRHLARHGCRLAREGGKHSLYCNPARNLWTTIPRHAEIRTELAKRICIDLGIPVAPGH